MANDINHVTITGNATADMDLRFTASGMPVGNVTLAHTPRRFDKNTNTWVDGDTLFLRCNLWGQAAENATETIRKGTRCIATGALKQRSWEKDGQQHTSIELDATEIAPSLRFATATITRTNNNSSGSGGGQRTPQGGTGFQNTQPAGNTWTQDDQPPF